MRQPSTTVPATGGPHAGLRIAMALYGTITNDSRVIREAETLAQAGHSVTVYCLNGRAPADASFRTVVHTPDGSPVLPDGSSPFLDRSRQSVPARVVARMRWLAGYGRTIQRWGQWAVADAGEIDVWHAHDLTGLLAIAPVLPRRRRLVYDSHEIFMETGTAARLPRPMRRLLAYLEGRLTRRSEALITVNETYAEVLNRRLRPRRTIIVRNCPPRWQRPTTPISRLRDAAGLGPDAQVVLYHGAFVRHRGLEQLAQAMLEPGLEGAHLVFLGFGNERTVVDRLALDPRFAGRLHVLDAVPPSELLEMIAGADVDAVPLQKSSLNHWLCTPNKLWESLTAGVPVVVSDFPAMHNIVLEDPDGSLGEICEPADPASIGAAICRILALDGDQRAALRERCLQAAETRWNWETESVGLLDLYAELAAEHGRAADATPA